MAYLRFFPKRFLSLAVVMSFMLFIVCLLMPGGSQALCEEIYVAAASNFTEPIKEIAGRFERQTGYKVILMFGSTGKHYSQIKNGAVIDIFFAADTNTPELLEKEGIAVSGSRFTYAIGKVVLWSPRAGFVDKQGEILRKGEFRYLSIANPKLAPYGIAAQQVLESLGLWQALKGRIVKGENIAQAYQFVKSGNAELGFVAYSQVKRSGKSVEGSLWDVPQSLYLPIEQQAVLLKDSEAALAFLSFIKNEESLEIIRSFGYDVP